METETEFDRDGVAIAKRAKGAANGTDDGLYHGMNQYKTFIQKREDSSHLAKGAGIRYVPIPTW